MNILKINGKEYILKYTFRGIAELQERGISLMKEQEFVLKDIVVLLHIGLKKFQPELTIDDVWDLMDVILEEMTLEDLMLTIQKALETSLGKRPPNPQA